MPKPEPMSTSGSCGGYGWKRGGRGRKRRCKRVKGEGAGEEGEDHGVLGEGRGGGGRGRQRGGDWQKRRMGVDRRDRDKTKVGILLSFFPLNFRIHSRRPGACPSHPPPPPPLCPSPRDAGGRTSSTRYPLGRRVSPCRSPCCFWSEFGQRRYARAARPRPLGTRVVRQSPCPLCFTSFVQLNKLQSVLTTYAGGNEGNGRKRGRKTGIVCLRSGARFPTSPASPQAPSIWVRWKSRASCQGVQMNLVKCRWRAMAQKPARRQGCQLRRKGLFRSLGRGGIESYDRLQVISYTGPFS